MGYYIGVDEAGYGPNLGPLVITATLWHVEDEQSDVDFYQLLSDVVTSTRIKDDQSKRILIADSKEVYSSGKGLGLLESAVLAALRVTGSSCDGLQQLIQTLDPACQPYFASIPWYQNHQQALPIAVSYAEVDKTYELLSDGLKRHGFSLLSINSSIVFPKHFNQLVEHHGNKGAALSHQSIDLVSRIVQQIERDSVLVICDKHGGRNRYGGLLQHYFPDSLIQVIEEGQKQSIYRWGKKPDRCEIRFQVGGESFLPAALASMTSKYLREIAMKAFNSFWCERLPNLKPTAGYPLDAKRFKAEIAPMQKKLKITDEVLWRCR